MTFSTKRAARLAAVATVVGTAACSDFLTVGNPGSVDADKLTDQANANLLVAGAIGEFQAMIHNTALWSGLLADELLSAHSNASYGPIDRRDFTEINDIVAGVYSPPSRARYAADSVADRLKAWLGPEESARDLRVARMLAMAGYGYIFLGETFCEAPIQLSAPLPPEELYNRAIPRFEEAIQIAEAARTAGAAAASVDSVVNLARVGAARAALNLGDLPRARTFAAAVPAGFEYRAYYTEGIPAIAGNPINRFWGETGSPNTATATELTSVPGQIDAGIRYSSIAAWIGVAEPFQGLNDPRVTHTTRRMPVMNSSTALQFIPNKPKSFGGYVVPGGARPGGAPITPGASIRVASGLEAQYIVAEAEGGNAATLAFVDAQRAANGQAPSTAATAEQVLADLRDQKRREFYLDGHRLGEMRRYKAQYGVDMFQTGIYLGGTDSYGSVECFPVPLSETNANPNMPRG